MEQQYVEKYVTFYKASGGHWSAHFWDTPYEHDKSWLVRIPIPPELYDRPEIVATVSEA